MDTPTDPEGSQSDKRQTDPGRRLRVSTPKELEGEHMPWYMGSDHDLRLFMTAT